MNKSMMNILACPIDKTYPLELHAVKEKEEVVLEETDEAEEEKPKKKKRKVKKKETD